MLGTEKKKGKLKLKTLAAKEALLLRVCSTVPIISFSICRGPFRKLGERGVNEHHCNLLDLHRQCKILMGER